MIQLLAVVLRCNWLFDHWRDLEAYWNNTALLLWQHSYCPRLIWKHQYLCFHCWDYLTNFWRNNWWSIIDGEERLCYLKGLDLYIHITLIQNIYLWRGLSFLGLGLIAFGTGGNYVCKFMKWFQHFSNQIFFSFFLGIKPW